LNDLKKPPSKCASRSRSIASLVASSSASRAASAAFSSSVGSPAVAVRSRGDDQTLKPTGRPSTRAVQRTVSGATYARWLLLIDQPEDEVGAAKSKGQL
jgi:hypothetical protein